MNQECIEKYNDLKNRKGVKYVIYKISDNQKEIIVDEYGNEADYEVFRQKITEKKDAVGKDRPSYAVYDVEFELQGGEGKR